MEPVTVKTFTRTYEVVVTYVNKDKVWNTWGRFIAARKDFKESTNEKLAKCVKCDHRFIATDNLYFCTVQGKGNKFLCETCIKEF